MNDKRMPVAAAAIVLIGIAAAPADAASMCPQPWCRTAEALVQGWLGERPAPSDEVIAPPADIDPQMALVPPGPRGALRVIRPHQPSERQQ